MSSFKLKQEEYPAVADFIIISFERDLSDFTAKYKTMDTKYLTDMKAYNTQVKESLSRASIRTRQRELTHELYMLADDVRDNVSLLREYARRGGIDEKIISKATSLLSRRNIEGSVKSIRDAVPYYTERIDMLKDMPDGFLDALTTDTTRLETLNAQQNKLINEGKQNTADNRELYEKLGKYMSEVCKSGKFIYKGTPKQHEYTLVKVIARVRAAKHGKSIEIVSEQ